MPPLLAPPSVASDTRHPDSHYQLLEKAIAPWLGKACETKRQQFKNAKPRPPAALIQASAAQQTRLKQLNGAHWQAQNAVDDALKNLQEAKAFARPILQEALKSRFGLELDVQTTYLRLYIPQTLPWFSIASGAARTWTVSLLDAALHNFEHGECQEGAFEPDSTFITAPSASGQFEVLPGVRQILSIAAFASLCRELDIGARYERYLNDALGFSEPVAQAVLQLKVDTSQKAAMRAALQLARITGDIQDDFALLVEAMIEGKPAIKLNHQDLVCHDLRMMDAPLTGILLLAPNLETTRTVARIVAYIPDDPQHPFKEYPSALTFKQALTQQLRDPQYQAFFSRFVAHDRRGVFFAQLSQRLARVTWHPPERGSNLAPWRKEPTDDPTLQFSATAIAGDPWQHLFQQKLNKILNDARTLAVATARVDQKARWALWDSFVNVASSILNAALFIVAPFIPGLGELMLGYMAYQLLDEVFEGIVDWAEDLTQEAFNHLMSVLQSLVQLGAFAAGGSIATNELRKVLPAQALKFIEGLKPVSLANGQSRYWQPDLRPYEQKIALAPHLKPNAQGLHEIRGELILPLEGKLYALQQEGVSGRYGIKHPTRTDAYTPAVRHNQAGAWHTELESPLQWDKTTLLRRLGHRAQDLSAADRELALTLSAVHEDAVRKMHVNSEPVPPLLDDSLIRLRIDRDIQTLITRLNSDDPAQYHLVDPQDMLQLLTSYGAWPHTKALRFLNAQGVVTWAFGDPTMPVVQIHEAQLDNGQLLKVVLQALSPEEIRAQFGERASDPQLSLETRVKNLKQQLAQVAIHNRAQLFESRYALSQIAQPPATEQLMYTATGLPASVAAKLVEHASGDELAELDQRRTPKRLEELAHEALEEVRLNRAYEGQHLDATQNIDSDRLALNTLKLLPGWSEQIHLELKHRSADGPTWLHIGPDDAPVRRTLVRTAEGRYVPHDHKGALFGETDLYSAILSALPDAQRDALNIGINQGPELKLRLRQRPLDRQQLRQVLATTEIREPKVETLRLLGNTEGYPVLLAHPNRPLTVLERARNLFPGLNDLQLHDLLNHLQTQPGGATNGIASLAQEYRQLDRDLQAWQNNTPTTHPRTAAPLSLRQRRYEHQNRRHFAAQLRRSWRRETEIDHYYDDPTRDGYILRLDLPILGTLAPLTANFEHISLLSLTGSADTAGANAFLAHFPGLRHLEVKGIALGTLPTQIDAMPQLNTLALSYCSVRLTPASHARIASMTGLQSLALNHNPLGLVPSVEAMPGLVILDLSDTGIEHLPPGLLSRPELQAALLSGNQITELPASLFELSSHDSKKFDLSDNPLSRATLERVKSYYQQHATYWEADAPDADIRDARMLYPSLDTDQINRLIFALPGDIEAGRIELARRTGELQTLQQELGLWEQEENLAVVERDRRANLIQLLEKTWRREFQQDRQFAHLLTIRRALAGDLPAMSVSFPHIGSLIIEGNGLPCQPDAFLKSFPALDILDIEDLSLGDIPLSVFDLQRLTFLGLPRCSIELSSTTCQALESMSGLRYLDLSHNPLDQLPDFSRLPGLTNVLLQNTGLRQIPQSLLTQVQRGTVDLSHNAIEQLPAIAFNLPASITRAFDVSDNPLSRQALEQVKSYCQNNHEFFNAQAPDAERARVQRLYPSLLENEADRFIFKLPGNMDTVAVRLSRLEDEYDQLTTDLEQWTLDVPTEHPLLGTPLDESSRAQEQLSRRHFKTLLEQAWRRESAEDEESLSDDFSYAVSLNTPILGALPELTARFNHVSSFEFKGNGTTTHVDGTLRGFPKLQTLILNQCALGRLPRSIFNMPQLANLELSACAISLSADTARTVADLGELEFLDLSNNPLGNSPDVSGMTRLSSLHLHDAELRQVPQGTFQLAELQTLDLSNNHIADIPADLLEMLQTFHDDCDLSANPWSQQSLVRLRTYYQRTGIDFNVAQASVDENGDPLVQPLSDPMEE